MDFSSFKLTECGTSAQTRVAEGRRTENGIHVEYYISTQKWDNGSRDYHEFRRIVRAFDGDDILYRRLCGLFDNCGVDGWANFHGKNPPYVLDGESMSFCLVLPDGTEIKAGGTNNFPENYGRISEELHEMIATEKISSTVFSDGTYQITLPESWVGNVSAEFSDGMVTFSFDRASRYSLSSTTTATVIRRPPIRAGRRSGGLYPAEMSGMSRCAPIIR